MGANAELAVPPASKAPIVGATTAISQIMRIVYHLGAHCTDEDRLVRCLLKNRGTLAQQGIIVPGPTRYRALLRDTVITLNGQPASQETQALVLEQIMEEDHADRMILSWDSFLSLPQWALKGRLYPVAAERVHAFTQVFPEIEAEFHLSIRNPATFLPLLFAKQRDRSFEQFMGGVDPILLSWSDVIEDIVDQNPGIPLTVWCDEDTPMIWPEVLQAVSGHAPDTELEDSDDLLAGLMRREGFDRMKAYLAQNAVTDPRQRRRVVSAFLDKFALPEAVEMDLELPGWTEDTVATLTAAYHTDIRRIRGLSGVTFLAP